MGASTIDTVIFDLGGVLVDWNPEYLYTKIFEGDTDKMKWFLNTVCTTVWNMEQDAGRSFEEEPRQRSSDEEYFCRTAQR